jgi:hypothetical protein
MKTLPFAACLTALCALALPAPQPVQAGTGLVRCEGGNGEVIYTDKACAAFGARPVPIPGELLTRLASDRDPATLTDAGGPATTALPAAPGRRSPAAGCARSPRQLARDLHGALALGDVNRVAESYHWIGHTHAQAHPVLARLERLGTRRLQDVQFFDATIGAASFADAGAPASARRDGMAGVMQLELGDDAVHEVVDFEVQRYAGCYFVRFRDHGHRA